MERIEWPNGDEPAISSPRAAAILRRMLKDLERGELDPSLLPPTRELSPLVHEEPDFWGVLRTHDHLRMIAKLRREELRATAANELKRAGALARLYSERVGNLASQAAFEHSFATIESIHEALRDPEAFLAAQAGKHESALRVGQAFCEFIEAHDRPPDSQAELAEASSLAKSTLSEGLKLLGWRVCGRSGRKRSRK